MIKKKCEFFQDLNYSKKELEKNPFLNLEHVNANKSDDTGDLVAFECLELTFDIHNESEDFIRIVEVIF